MVRFRYHVVRIWQESVADLLAAGPGVAPLALLTNEADANLPAALGRFRESLRSAGFPDNIQRGLLGSVFFLCGLRYPPDRIDELYRNLGMTLEDSTTYQMVVNRGALRGNRELILRLGTDRYGPAPAETRAVIEAIADQEELVRVAGRLFHATDWADLLRSN